MCDVLGCWWRVLVFVVDGIVFGADNEGLVFDGFGGKGLPLLLLGIVGICAEAGGFLWFFVEAFDEEAGFVLEAFDALGCGGNLNC